MSTPRQVSMDAYARHCIADTPNVIVSWWMMASWLYSYDELCGDLDARWDAIEHPHKHLVDRAALSAGSGFTLTEDGYPLRVKGAAEYILSVGPLRMPVRCRRTRGARRPPARTEAENKETRGAVRMMDDSARHRGYGFRES